MRTTRMGRGAFSGAWVILCALSVVACDGASDGSDGSTPPIDGSRPTDATVRPDGSLADADVMAICDGVGCSGNGRCVVLGGEAACACDAGYRASGTSCVEAGQRFGHVRTFGFDYWYLDGDDLPQLRALAERHDVIIGGQHWTQRRHTAAQVEALAGLDPAAQLVGYFAYHSQNISRGSSRDTMEAWAVENGYGLESIYCHYQVDSTVRITGTPTTGDVLSITPGSPPTITVGEGQELFAGERIIISGVNGGSHPSNGTWVVLPASDTTRTEYRLYAAGSPPSAAGGGGWASVTGAGTFTTDNCDGSECTITVPGWPDGWAEKESDSRVLARWNGGWPAACPIQEGWRRSSEQWVRQLMSVRDSSVFSDGIFLDTFDGMALSGGYWSEELPNIREVRERAGTTPTHEAAEELMWSGIVQSALELDTFLKTETGNPNFMTIPNGSDIRGVYRDSDRLWNGTEGRRLGIISIEFMAMSTTNQSLIPQMQRLYEDLESGRRIFVRSQTNVGRPTAISHAFKSFLLASNYMLLHQNGWYWVHEGNAGFYGGAPAGTLIDTGVSPAEGTHWMPNQEVDIGTPRTRSEADYWGMTGTDRFYDFDPSSPSGHVVLARDFTNALVLARYGVTGGIDNVGTGASAVSLGGTYYPLLADNSTGPAVTEWTFGQSEGVILMRAPR